MKSLVFSIFLIAIATPIFGQNQNAEKRLDSLFTTLAAQNQFSGSVLIANKGKVVYKGGKGYSNELTKEKNNPKTIFELASCSKQFTGVGIVLLNRENKLNYTDDITKYISELSSFKGVTIYDLLRHTSGIPEFLAKFREDWKNERIATNEDVVNYYSAGKDTLDFAPGSKHRYSNTNYVLLATIIERVSNQKFADYLSEKIFKPLKMNRTFVYNRRANPRKIVNYAYGYSWIKNSFVKAPEDDPRIGQKMYFYMDGIVGAAKVNSTVEDIYTWITAIKNNTLLSKEEFEEVMAITETSNGKKNGYSFGFEVRRSEGDIRYGHTGSWDGYASFTHYSSKHDRTIVILNNFNKGTYAYRTILEILDSLPNVNEYVKKISLPAAEMEKFVGEYSDSTKGADKILITYLENHLIYNTNKSSWDMRFFPTSANTFQAIRQGGADGMMKFTKQSDGTMKLEMTEGGKFIGNGIRE